MSEQTQIHALELQVERLKGRVDSLERLTTDNRTEFREAVAQLSNGLTDLADQVRDSLTRREAASSELITEVRRAMGGVSAADPVHKSTVMAATGASGTVIVLVEALKFVWDNFIKGP